MKEDFGSAVREAIRVWFNDEYPEGLSRLNEKEPKYTKKYFDTIEKDLGEVTKI